MEHITDILYAAAEAGASDIHITAGVPVVIRIHGELKYYNQDVLTPADAEEYVHCLMSEKQWESYQEEGEYDFSYSLKGLVRFRINSYHQRSTCCAALRIINADVPPLEKLGLPPVVSDLAMKNSGMILVTGPTGSGKSTTLASMVNLINQNKNKHIITLEDPIEYLFKHGMSMINQREIGSDSKSFANALRACLRQDPDVILVGEMRDFETISIALTAAETGHLVLSTLHTIGAASTIDRVIDVFPPSQQEQIRVQLAMVLQAVISQQLLTRNDLPGRCIATEVMITTPAVKNMIREAKVHQLNNVIKTSANQGMMLMDDSLIELYRAGKISKDNLYEHCVDKGNLNYI